MVLHSHSHTIELIRRRHLLGAPHVALAAHRAAQNLTLLLHNLTLRALSDHGLHRHLLSLFADLHCSDHFTFPSVIKACAVLTLPAPLKQTHCAVLRARYRGNMGIETTLLNAYAKTDFLDYAIKVFDGMPDKDRIAWNAMISGYSLNGLAREAVAAFRRMQADGIPLSGSTFISLVSACSKLGAAMAGRTLHCLAVKCGAFGDEALALTLMSMYSSYEDLTAARLLFETLPVKDTVAWNAMVSAYAQSGEQDEAFEVFRHMRSSYVRPNVITMVYVVYCTDKLSMIRYGKSVHVIRIKFGLSDEVSVVCGLVLMYAKFGEMDTACCLFHSTPEKELFLWNSMISGCLLNGLCYMCLDTYSTKSWWYLI